MSGIPLSRRGLLSGAGLTATVGAASLLAGCRFDPAPPTRPAASSTPDPDASVLAAARAELASLIIGLSGSRRAASLVACHRTQLLALGGQPPSTRRTHPLTTTETVLRERRAVVRFTHWAETCRDGDLARVLASVAAGIRMQPELQAAA
ncbi:hypothetical protein [Nocardioides cynanchi]|uniref:hypothetical protein n=1 Tax=Nocardioides cynanchi TaxID=2558918 RepID=UPI001247820E|nr:hypothetical protein [Nocardioides cynanchi]